jgi:hypothetical protein
MAQLRETLNAGKVRRSPQPLLCGLEQARRSALEDHVHRPARLGPWVLIIGMWYYMFLFIPLAIGTAFSFVFARLYYKRFQGMPLGRQSKLTSAAASG